MAHAQWIIVPNVNDKVKVELNRDIIQGEVKEINGFLAKIHFIEKNRFEWIFLGSPRIYKVYRHYISIGAFDKLIKFKTYKPCLSAHDEFVKIDLIEPVDKFESKQISEALTTANMNVNKLKNHKCTKSCIDQEDEKRKNLKICSALQRPLITGWKRFVQASHLSSSMWC